MSLGDGHRLTTDATAAAGRLFVLAGRHIVWRSRQPYPRLRLRFRVAAYGRHSLAFSLTGAGTYLERGRGRARLVAPRLDPVGFASHGLLVMSGDGGHALSLLGRRGVRPLAAGVSMYRWDAATRRVVFLRSGVLYACDGRKTRKLGGVAGLDEPVLEPLGRGDVAVFDSRRLLAFDAAGHVLATLALRPGERWGGGIADSRSGRLAASVRVSGSDVASARELVLVARGERARLVLDQRTPLAACEPGDSLSWHGSWLLLGLGCGEAYLVPTGRSGRPIRVWSPEATRRARRRPESFAWLGRPARLTPTRRGRGIPVGPFALATVDRRCFLAPSPATGWPLAPIDQAHPIRGGINDPRPGGAHFGIDIEAPAGASVYAVAGGVVAAPEGAEGPQRLDARQFAIVTPGSAQRFLYWHVHPVGSLRVGTVVRPGERIGTVVGRFMHVHLSEWAPGCGWVDPRRPTSPLHDRADTERPHIGSLHAFLASRAAHRRPALSRAQHDTATPVSLDRLHGVVDLRASVSDTPRDRTRLTPQQPLMVAATRAYVAPDGHPGERLTAVARFDGATVIPLDQYRTVVAYGTQRRTGCLWHADRACFTRLVLHVAGRGFDTATVPDGRYQYCVQALTIENVAARRCTPIRIAN